MHDRDDITEILERVSLGDRYAMRDLLPLVYAELRAVARRSLGSRVAQHSLQPTALVHEVYLRLLRDEGADYQNRTHFFAVAARAMRQILIDHARRRRTAKRGANWRKMSLDQLTPIAAGREADVLDLEAALVGLEKLDERKARVVELRFFGGLTNEQTAEVLGVSRKTVASDWTVARAWLAARLHEIDES